ncbi:Oidioi.mRNA.OKI2018_I69.PAR.g9538.t1.cds [Oikopleura dioica]|uniref:Oidioi.mRNA.OKI2018_I69.PAR.g9538.t1.cds n=1 Tax=Oikopleura dioica TaxID=34765 RepID=A0ABN7RLD6_OIKDI|nr:Oidioi.mRNA.OKI2018_I69.PAR.g9538.t1.cds [Oikopleura dioica]
MNLILMFFLRDVLGRRSKAVSKQKGDESQQSTPAGSPDILLELTTDNYSFAEETWHLTILEFSASFFVGIVSIAALIIMNEIRQMRVQHVCPFDFSNARDPIDRCQSLRYILTRSQNILPERTKTHKEILLNLWESEFLMDKYEIFYVMSNPAEEFEFVRRSLAERDPLQKQVAMIQETSNL